MSKKFLFVTIAILVLIFTISACNGSLIPSTGEQDLQATQNYLIVQAAQGTATQLAFGTLVAQIHGACTAMFVPAKLEQKFIAAKRQTRWDRAV